MKMRKWKGHECEGGDDGGTYLHVQLQDRLIHQVWVLLSLPVLSSHGIVPWEVTSWSQEGFKGGNIANSLIILERKPIINCCLYIMEQCTNNLVDLSLHVLTHRLPHRFPAPPPPPDLLSELQ